MPLACATEREEPLAADSQGVAELRIDDSFVTDLDISKVVIRAEDGRSQTVTRNRATGTFDGALLLSEGTHSLVASAFTTRFLIDTLVGQSRPTPVEVRRGAITRVMIQILDLAVPPSPKFGPIIDSLSFPTTVEAGDAASFAISVVVPASGVATYSWTSTCQDATFSAATEATTSWTKPSEGVCTINVVAAANGFSVSQSFVIAVFAAGANNGAVMVSGVFVTAPGIDLSLLGCIGSTGQNSSCQAKIASPAEAPYQLTVFNWGSAVPGTIELSDDCGGRFDEASRNPGDRSGAWLPPVDGGLCIITARAINDGGLAEVVAIALLTRPGTPPMAAPVESARHQ
jgi:hypothetical protein